MKCDFCGKDESLPFVCNYCGGAYCADHRLPEAHQCKGDLTQRRTILAPPQTTFSWQTGYAQTKTRQPGAVFSAIEVRDIIIAWLGLGVAFFFSFVGGFAGLAGIGSVLSRSRGFTELTTLLLISLVTIGSGFVLHELSHKFVAQRYGYWAEFRMWPFGLILALVTSLIGFIFAAPGATYISGTNISEAENGKISLAGPLTNVVVAGFFSILMIFGSGFLQYVGTLGAYFNTFLALFNLVPFGPLDGSKVLRWSAPLWVGIFVPLAAVFVFAFLL